MGIYSGGGFSRETGGPQGDPHTVQGPTKQHPSILSIPHSLHPTPCSSSSFSSILWLHFIKYSQYAFVPLKMHHSEWRTVSPPPMTLQPNGGRRAAPLAVSPMAARPLPSSPRLRSRQLFSVPGPVRRYAHSSTSTTPALLPDRERLCCPKRHATLTDEKKCNHPSCKMAETTLAKPPGVSDHWYIPQMFI